MLPVETIDRLFNECLATEGYRLTINLRDQQVVLPGGDSVAFEVDSFRKHCLLEGLDDIGLTLEHAETIKQYEQQRMQQQPWLFK